MAGSLIRSQVRGSARGWHGTDRIRRGISAWLGGALVLALLAGCSGDDSAAVSASSLEIAGALNVDCAAFGPDTPPLVQLPGIDLPALGSRELAPEEIDRLMIALADREWSNGARIVTGVAAKSVNGRDLRYAIVGRKERVTPAALDSVRRALARLADPDAGTAEVAKLAAETPALLWVSANVHGSEKSGADAALRVLYELATREDCAAQRIRDQAIVVVLPMQNPDGRLADSRRNAYGFDLNRDWFARTQPETDGKLELLRQYRPQLYIDAHETSLNHYFFPPTADPTYHEVPQSAPTGNGQSVELAFGWINRLYAPAIEAGFDRFKIPYFHGAPYDLYAVEYGDSVPTVGLHAAGMTFEKYSGAPMQARTFEHYVAMWSALFAAVRDKPALLTAWHLSHADARDQGLRGDLQPNGVYYDARKLEYPLPADAAVRHYFLRADQPAREVELARLVRRLQRMDVQVWQLQAPLVVPNFRAYGSQGLLRSETLPAGSYWIPMAQAQKHWIQAMLHHEPHIPVSVSYDITAWSNPLLMNLDGGSSADDLKPKAALVPLQAPVRWRELADGARNVRVFEIPGSGGAESAGTIRHLFEQVWERPYQTVSAAELADPVRMQGVDVLLVPDGYANYALQALGSKGQKVLADWVRQGGRYVGYLGGTELAVKIGVSSALLSVSHTTAPGALIRADFDGTDATTHPLARGMGSVWVMYDDYPVMRPGLGSRVASFRAGATGTLATSGLAQNLDELVGSAAVIDEPVGQGRSIVLSFDPNFRGWTDGTQRLLWNALFGADPMAQAQIAQTRITPAQAGEDARRAAAALPDTGRPIRIVVRAADADATRALIRRHGAEFSESAREGRVVFLIANREGLGRDEHPYALELARELSQQLKPIAVSLP